MKKKMKLIFLLVLIFAILSPAFAQDRVDLVILLDSSRSMFPYYEQVVDYVVSGALREYMRFGDAFHLISFSDNSQLELSQHLRTENDLRAVIARLYLLYPLGESTDIIAALKNTWQFVDNLPASSRKYIILISDGMHSPSASSPWASLDSTSVKAEIESSARKFTEHGWTLRIVRVPFDHDGVNGLYSEGDAHPGAPGSGDYLDNIASAAGVSTSYFDPADAGSALDSAIALPRISAPQSIGKTDYAFTLPLIIENRSDETLHLELVSLFLDDGSDVLRKKVFSDIPAGKSVRLKAPVLLPEKMEEGEQILIFEPGFADGMRVSPARVETELFLKKSLFSIFFRNTARIIVFAALLVLAIGIIILLALIIRSVQKKSEQPIMDAVLDSQSYQTGHASAQSAQSEAQLAQLGAQLGAAPVGLARSATTTTGSTAPGSSQQSYQQGYQHDPHGGSPQRSDAILESYRADRRDAAALLAGAAEGKSTPDAGQSRTAELQIASQLALKTDSDSRRAEILNSWSPKADDAEFKKLERLPAITYRAELKKPGVRRFELVVEGQNPNIGKRNIKTMRAASSLTLGGRASDFLVFLLPVPNRIADIYYDGENLTLVPVKRSYFPWADAPVKDCLDKDMAIMLPDGKKLVFRISPYIPKVEKLNNLLRCIFDTSEEEAEA